MTCSQLTSLSSEWMTARSTPEPQSIESTFPSGAADDDGVLARAGVEAIGASPSAHVVVAFAAPETIVSAAGENAERVVGTTFGRRNRPHLLEAWGQRFDVQLDEHLAVFRYDDRPGMIGRIGTAFGEAGVNIVSAAVGRKDEAGDGAEAVMVVTTDGPVPHDVVASVVAGGGFKDGRAISL